MRFKTFLFDIFKSVNNFISTKINSYLIERLLEIKKIGKTTIILIKDTKNYSLKDIMNIVLKKIPKDASLYHIVCTITIIITNNEEKSIQVFSKSDETDDAITNKIICRCDSIPSTYNFIGFKQIEIRIRNIGEKNKVIYKYYNPKTNYKMQKQNEF